MEVFLESPGKSSDTLTIVTVGAAFAGAVFAVWFTHFLAGERRRREALATLLSLQERLTGARVIAENARTMELTEAENTRVTEIIGGPIVHDHILELDNRLSIKELQALGMWLFFAPLWWQHWLEGDDRGWLELAIESIYRSQRLIGLAIDMTPRGTRLRHPSRWWKMRQERKSLVDSLSITIQPGVDVDGPATGP